jgi:N-carbamoyl-L-amino-acid hydrolase
LHGAIAAARSGLTAVTARANLRIDIGRLWSTLDASAEIGKGRPPGLRRLALGDADKRMRDTFVDWCEAAGLTVTHDAMGNLFARRAGADDTLDPVVVGSHLDTQVAGGRYDGILGVLGGLEVVRTLNDAGIATRRPIEVACWTNEEGARFQPPMMGSSVFAGVLDVDAVRATCDDDGVSVGDELDRLGYAATATAAFGRAFDSYFELHIEQAPALERAGLPLGIVTGGYKTHGLRLRLTGRTGHAGPTEMSDRRDALAAAAKIVSAVFDIGHAHADAGGKATCPQLLPWPNKPGIICEQAVLSADCRHPDADGADAMLAEIEAAVADAAALCAVEAEVLQRWSFGDEAFSDDLIALCDRTAQALGVPTMRMLSQAGHDAYPISRIAPTVILFTPCADGVSHNEAEAIDPETTEPGLNVLLHSVLERADRAGSGP